MKTLIVEDDFITRRVMKEILGAYGDLDIAIDGMEAVQAFRLAWEEHKPYDLICMDIMMPNMDGQEALQRIRDLEKDMGIQDSREVKVVMTTALGDPKTVVKAFYKGGATSYIVKPVRKEALIGEIRNLGLID